MIFAQYKHAITFALAIMALAVMVADPGSKDAGDPATTDAAVAQPAPQDRPIPAAAAADPDWYGASADEAELAVTPEDAPVEEATGDEANHAVAPAAATARTSRPAAAPAPAAQAGGYVPPPPPPQNFQP